MKTTYYDSFAGLIPAKRVSPPGLKIDIEITRSRGPYRKGEILTGIFRHNFVQRAGRNKIVTA